MQDCKGDSGVGAAPPSLDTWGGSEPENAHEDLGASTATVCGSVLQVAESVQQKSIHQ